MAVHSASATTGCASTRSQRKPGRRQDRLQQRAGQPEHEQQRAEVGEQQVLEHVREEELVGEVRERRDERRHHQRQPAVPAPLPPRRHGRAAVAQRACAQPVHDADHDGGSELQRRDLEGHVGDVSQTSNSLGSVPGMSDRTTPPFRADHVGSLLRPPELLQAREDFANDRIDADELRAIEDEAIRDVVKLQEDVGLQSATDGEFRRASWHMDFIYQLGGISKSPGNLSVKFHNAEGDIEFTPAAMHIDGKVTLEKPIFAHDFEFLQSVVDHAPRRSSRSRARAWSTTAAGARRSRSRSTRTWTSSGTT